MDAFVAEFPAARSATREARAPVIPLILVPTETGGDTQDRRARALCYDEAVESKPIDDNTASSPQLGIAGRRLRCGVWQRRGDAGSYVVERTFEPGSDITIGSDAAAGLVLPDWAGPKLLLIEGGDALNLEPGMRLHMCHDNGEERVEGTFEELVARGMMVPIRIAVSKLNIRVRDGISVLAHYLPDEARI